MALLNQVGAVVTDGRRANLADALEKDGLDDMALVLEIRKRLFVHYQPVEVEPEREAKRYAFVELAPESATARETAWKGQLGHAKKVLWRRRRRTRRRTRRRRRRRR
jgi:hypothetical protein